MPMIHPRCLAALILLGLAAGAGATRAATHHGPAHHQHLALKMAPA
jgi:hypothetical protein